MRTSHTHLFIALVAIIHPSEALEQRDLEELAKRSGSERAPHHIRDVLGQQAIYLIHEHGQNVDISLEGYDHDLVARSFEEGAFQPRSFDEDVGLGDTQKFGRMEAHPVVEERDAALRRREPLAQQETAVREKLGDGVDYSLNGYDDALLAWSSDVDYSLEGYDHSLLGCDLEEEDNDEEIDYSLEGYDHALVARASKRSLVEDEIAGPSKPTAIKRPPMMAKREVVDAGSLASTVVRSWTNMRRWIEERLG